MIENFIKHEPVTFTKRKVTDKRITTIKEDTLLKQKTTWKYK